MKEWFKEDASLEIGTMDRQGCWTSEVFNSSTMSTLVPLMWVFKYKPDPEGYISRCRSRIVVRGDLQSESTIVSTYASTLSAKSFRIAMALAAHFDLEVKCFDVINAFINALRDIDGETVYCRFPPGFDKPGHVLRVDRALYGMRDSPYLWYKHVSKTLTDLGLIPCSEEPCMFTDPAHKILVLFYVDDIQVLYHRDDSKLGQDFIKRLNQAYDMHDLGDIKQFLGIKIVRDRKRKTISLVHSQYIEKITRKFEQADERCPTTPLPQIDLVKNKGQASKKHIKAYQERVGSVLYTAIVTRLNVAFAIA
jgi:hypothetical protein